MEPILFYLLSQTSFDNTKKLTVGALVQTSGKKLNDLDFYKDQGLINPFLPLTSSRHLKLDLLLRENFCEKFSNPTVKHYL